MRSPVLGRGSLDIAALGRLTQNRAKEAHKGGEVKMKFTVFWVFEVNAENTFEALEKVRHEPRRYFRRDSAKEESGVVGQVINQITGKRR